MNLHLFSGLLALAAPIAAAHATDLSVQGQITPSACTITLPQGDALDFGELTPTPTLDGKWAFTESRTVPVSISCFAKTNVGLVFSDLLLAESPEDKDGFVLANADGDHLAMVELRIPHGIADGKRVDFSMLRPSASGSHLVRVDDPGNYMQIGDSNGSGFEKVTANMQLTMLGVDLDIEELAAANGMHSQVGIAIHYL